MAGDDEAPRHPQAGGPSGYMRRVGDTEPRVLGFAYHQPEAGPRHNRDGLRHPLRWLRWRAEVIRKGPYAPGFDPTGAGGHREDRHPPDA